MPSFLQSDEWNQFQKHLARETFTDQGDDWSYLAVKETGTLNTRIYTPYGPVSSNIDGFNKALTSLKALAKNEKATFIRVEPQTGVSIDQLRNLGFKPVTYQQLQPSHTQVIDLTKDKDSILSSMTQNSRNITRNYHKKGISIRKSYDPADITILTSLLSLVSRKNEIKTHSESYFAAQADTLLTTKAGTIYIAEFANKPIAVALIYDSDTTRTYAHAAADPSHRKLNAGTAIVGQMILDAKDKGLTEFDLYGIADTEDPNHPWAGFTKFKKSFGGSPVTYPGAWDLPVKKLEYKLYRTYQSLYRILR